MPIPNFEDAEALLMSTTDAWLGDTIAVKIPPGGFVNRKGFVLYDGSSLDGGGSILDSLNRTRRIKLPKSIFQAEPDRTIRFQSVKLGPGTFQIAGDVESEAYHYLFDIQEAGD